MTDEQIIKASKICGNNENCCKCPYYRSPSEIAIDCNDRLTLDALDLIKRQQEEIESLEADYENVYKQASADILASIADGGTSCEWCIDNHRAEAAREFAERLKAREQWEVEYREKIIFTSDIDNLVNEMTEKEGGK
jgi:AhpD family alkylhydroperoxidase